MLSMENRRELEQRLIQTVVKYGIILVIGFAYLVFVLITGLRIPCLFNVLTGLKCTGCGVTRLIVSLFKFDFVAAFWYNPFLFITGPFLLAYLVFCEYRYIKTGNREMGRWEIFIWVELFLAIVYGVLRNILPI